MPASPASVSSERAEPRLLVVGLNWLGDAVMSMPALAVLRARRPGASLTMLVRPALAELWALCPFVDRVEVQSLGFFGTFRTAAKVRSGGVCHGLGNAEIVSIGVSGTAGRDPREGRASRTRARLAADARRETAGQ